MSNNIAPSSLFHHIFHIHLTHYSPSHLVGFVLLLAVLQLSLLRDAGKVHGNSDLTSNYLHDGAINKQKRFGGVSQIQQPHQLQGGHCPYPCTCRGQNIDCSYRNLRAVPSPFPSNAERINLIGNKITLIKANDFRGLRQLKVLQLANNEIEDILDGAFTDLVKLKRIRLNGNSLKNLRDNLFQFNTQLQKLELKDNQLTCIYQNTFNGLKNLRQLHLENNRLAWIAKDVFRDMKELTTLLLGGNPFKCNCNLRWLHIYINQHHLLGQDAAQCTLPISMQGRLIASIPLPEFECSPDDRNVLLPECGTHRCSVHCSCSVDGNADCKNRGLTIVPDDLPDTIQEIDLQSNAIEVLPPRAFSKFKNLRKLFLNQNKIQRLPENAFEGLTRLTSLHLNHNHLRALPRDVFKTLTNLKFLYIHGNKISCLPQGCFDGLHQLYLLHLSENQITSVQNGTFADLKNLRYLYMVSNPFICDCNLAWLTDFLSTREGAGGSESALALCAAPERMKGSQVFRTPSFMFQCLGDEGVDTAHAGQCDLNHRCPKQCECTETKVNCTGKQLIALPTDIPPGTVELTLRGNQIEEIHEDSILSKLPALKKLDLGDNKVIRIHSGSFALNSKLEELNLSGNQISQINDDTFKNLINLRVLLLQNNKLRCLNNDTFVNLLSLKILMINDNMLKCIMRGTFDKLKQLQTLGLHNNPFNCNCHLNWMSQWLRTNVDKISRHPAPVCATPALLYQTPITAIEPEHFVCGGVDPVQSDSAESVCQNGGITMDQSPCCTKDSISCDSRAQCPAQCVCEGTRVMCNDKKLQQVPGDIPLDTEELFLERNNINDINSTTFAGLTKLRILSLSYNGISELPAHTFSNLTSLATLILSYNRLQCIHEEAFRGAYYLRTLILQSNDISTIPYGTFSDLRQLNTIALGHNPFYCDCNIKWLNEFFHSHFLDNGISLCSGPQRMENRPIYHSKPSDFVCTADERAEETFWGVRTKCDICMREPCKNGGHCQLIGESRHRYRCVCQHPFHGTHCEQQINACFGQPCQNNGTCRVIDNYGKYECVCAEGFTGSRCTQNINDCVRHKCANGGRCVDGVNNYTCECPAGYRGQYCEQEFTYCKDTNPCLNAGQCIQIHHGYQCVCPEGWVGKNCEENVDDCKYNSCQNGASCNDLVNNYSCACRPGYQGRYCQHFAWNPPESQITSSLVCSFYTCQNGGRCVESGINHYCKCSLGYDGKYCEKLRHVQFNKENSYARFKPERRSLFQPKGNITLLFTTKQDEGILLYYELSAPNVLHLASDNSTEWDTERQAASDFPEEETESIGGNQFLSVDIFQGHLRLAFSVGKSPGAEGFSVAKVNTGELFKVHLDIVGENISLFLNDHFQFRVQAPFEESHRHLNLQAPIYIGGGPLSLTRMAKSSGRVMSTHSFAGCVLEAYVNSRIVDFAASEQTHIVNVIPGCSEKLTSIPPPKPPNPCKDENACLNDGKCQPDPTSPQQYKCFCNKGYSGPRCENVSLCSGRVQFMKIRDPVTHCVSRRKVKMMECSGICTNETVSFSNNIKMAMANKGNQRSVVPSFKSPSSGLQVCCQPMDSKTIRMRFLCLNGKMYEKHIQIPRQCGCSICSNTSSSGLR